MPNLCGRRAVACRPCAARCIMSLHDRVAQLRADAGAGERGAETDTELASFTLNADQSTTATLSDGAVLSVVPLSIAHDARGVAIEGQTAEDLLRYLVQRCPG